MMPKPNTSQRLNNLPSNIDPSSRSVPWSSADRLQVAFLMAALTGPELHFHREMKYSKTNNDKKSRERAQHTVPVRSHTAINAKIKNTLHYTNTHQKTSKDTWNKKKQKTYKHESLTLSAANMRWCMTCNPQAWSNLSECAFGLSVWNSLIWNTSQTGWPRGHERASAMWRCSVTVFASVLSGWWVAEEVSPSFEVQLGRCRPLVLQLQLHNICCSSFSLLRF